MSAQPSTVRTSSGSSVEDPPASANQIESQEAVLTFWRRQPGPDSLAVLEAFPALVHQKSLFLDLVLEEYKSRRKDSPELGVPQFSERFSNLSRALQQSIIRLLEVQDYLDQHPELLDLVEEFEWPKVGDVIQNFRVIDELGRGAVARVYLCRESNVGERAVVLKVARGGMYEADLLGRLSHANIMPVYSITNDPACQATYICMPFRGRCTLQDVVDHVLENGVPRTASALVKVARSQHAPVDVGLLDESLAASAHLARGSYVDAVINVCIQIAAALAHAHVRGVLHGDLKPSNVLLTIHGLPLLIDFNLAKAQWVEIAPRGGTLPYMAPEQLTAIRRNSDESMPAYDVRSEIYSFGVMLFQLLTGRLPFRVDHAVADPASAANDLLTQQRSQPPRVRDANRAVNARLEALVRQCLEWEASRRPTSMDEVQKRLQAEVGWASRVRRTLRTRPLATTSATIAVTSLAVGTTVFYALRPPYEERQFNRGLALQSAGEYELALSHFDNVLADQPASREALYQAARTHMLAGDLDAAIADFSRLRTEFGDLRALAYVGYCFNLLQQPSLAIDKYERALASGFESCGLHNNLGVSYAIARSQLGYVGQLTKAQEHLNRAFELDGKSLTVRRNLISLALLRSSQDPAHIPADALQHVDAILGAMPDDAGVWLDAAALYGFMAKEDSAFADKCLSSLQSAFQKGGSLTKRQLDSLPSFAAIRSRSEFAQLRKITTTADRPSRKQEPLGLIDPVEGADSRASLD